MHQRWLVSQLQHPTPIHLFWQEEARVSLIATNCARAPPTGMAAGRTFTGEQGLVHPIDSSFAYQGWPKAHHQGTCQSH